MALSTPLAVRPIRPTVAGRLADYLNQLFPPAVYLPSGIASFLAIHLSLQALAGRGALVLGWRAVLGAISVVLFTLVLRLNDEVKDFDSDRALAAEGDEKYRDRATVTGHVRLDDLRALRRWVIAALVGINLWFGSLWPLAGFVLVLLVLWASARWFFWPRIQRNLLLAFATHNPIAVVVGAYVVAVFAGEHGGTSLGWSSALPVIVTWLPIAAWETSRKVRAPGDETRYQTYSLLLGWKVAAWLPPAFALATVGALVLLARATGLGWPFLALASGSALVMAGASLRFRLHPSARTAQLRPFAELFVVVVTIGLVVALAVQRGVRWG